MEEYSAQAIRACLESSCADWQLEFLEETDSTNTRLKEQAKAGCPGQTALCAARQTAGRGRLGRSFLSPEGGLYLSLLVRPRLHLSRCTRLTVIAAVCVTRALQSLCGLEVQIKWVNDLYVGGKKLCGILTEASPAPDGTADWAVVGIGLNIARPNLSAAPELADLVTSLEEQGCTVGRAALAAAVLREFDRCCADLAGCYPAALAEYRQRMFLTGQTVTILGDPAQLPYTVLGVDDNAALVVRAPDGTTRVLQSGEISVRAVRKR